MMILKQNVNFYQVEEEYTPLLSATRLFQIWGALFAILALVAIEAKWTQHFEIKRIEDLKTTRDEINAQLQAMGKELKAKNNPQKLQEELLTLRDKISKTQTAISQLQVQENNQTYQLSAYLEGFALSHVKGMYVSHFYMQNEGKKMAFDGDALAPQLVPQMVQAWEKSTVMKGRRFQKLNISRIKDNSQSVKFNLQAE